MQEAHNSVYAGLLAYTETLHAVQRNNTWPCMAEQIHKYVRGVIFARETKTPRSSLQVCYSLLQCLMKHKFVALQIPFQACLKLRQAMMLFLSL